MLPKTAEYALRAVVWLARDARRAESADQIAKSIRVPRRYLHKVLQELIKAGLLRSQPGPGGGYRLQRKPGEISILDVINSVGSIERIRACPLGLETHTSLCPLHQELDKAYAEMEAAFGRVSIDQILSQPSPILPLQEISAG